MLCAAIQVECQKDRMNNTAAIPRHAHAGKIVTTGFCLLSGCRGLFAMKGDRHKDSRVCALSESVVEILWLSSVIKKTQPPAVCWKAEKIRVMFWPCRSHRGAWQLKTNVVFAAKGTTSRGRFHAHESPVKVLTFASVFCLSALYSDCETL